MWPEQAGLSGAAHRGQASQGPPIPGNQSSAHGDPPHWKYQEGIFFGLTLRQFLCAFGAVAVALAVYFFLGPALGGSDVGWACVLAAAPFALCGFYRYNSMTFEQFILAVIRSELLYPKRLVFKSDHLYTKALENATIKEALKLD